MKFDKTKIAAGVMLGTFLACFFIPKFRAALANSFSFGGSKKAVPVAGTNDLTTLRGEITNSVAGVREYARTNTDAQVAHALEQYAATNNPVITDAASNAIATAFSGQIDGINAKVSALDSNLQSVSNKVATHTHSVVAAAPVPSKGASRLTSPFPGTGATIPVAPATGKTTATLATVTGTTIPAAPVQSSTNSIPEALERYMTNYKVVKGINDTDLALNSMKGETRRDTCTVPSTPVTVSGTTYTIDQQLEASSAYHHNNVLKRLFGSSYYSGMDKTTRQQVICLGETIQKYWGHQNTNVNPVQAIQP